LVVVGACLAAWSILSFVFRGEGTAAPFDPARRLFIRGAFRCVRNPISVGAAAALSGAALYFHSWGLLGYAAAIAVIFHVLVLVYEEPVLRRSFGADYDAYCTRVPRWLGWR